MMTVMNSERSPSHAWATHEALVAVALTPERLHRPSGRQCEMIRICGDMRDLLPPNRSTPKVGLPSN